MPADPITIKLLNPIGRVCVNEPMPLALVVHCPADGKPAELRHIGSRDSKAAELDADLFERDLMIQPGEVYRCTVVARFHATGSYPEPLFVLQVGRDKDTARVRVPTPAIRVVPSLLNEVRVQVESICTYEHDTKADVTVSHTGSTPFDDFHLTLHPGDMVRAGVSEQRRPSFNPGEQFKFTTVLAAQTIDLLLDATSQGERVGPVTVRLPIPAVSDVQDRPPFRFLEPKKLTQAEVKITTLDEELEPVPVKSGVHVLRGGGTKYRVTIKPAHPNTKNVNLRGVSGLVEVENMPAHAGVWSFQIVVRSNYVFSTNTALHYDVFISDGDQQEGAQQGEINLAIRPQSVKLWTVALTAGFALTAKGLVGLFSTVFSASEPWSMLSETLTKSETLWELAQLVAVPVIRGGLWVADQVAQPFLDG